VPVEEADHHKTTDDESDLQIYENPSTATAKESISKEGPATSTNTALLDNYRLTKI